ncbi:HAD-IIB family hydrolase [Streptococcus moroccensis]|uniref:Cof subfamily protein (Haloacid dehalogenase superfamily) n=1 Tax=Streptococcus moroccensis TaxID=1451356 RepID=A0ABT9YRD9_9STRE|nr:HAD-IIB family hydrolase [Streptococcus moroccensis]MDQ0222564.1 Cof subfamily protein (haloacid dehalogenase superfamily) [Streptococcus moroccensis]
MRFVFDLDGTLVFGDNQISPEITKALNNLKALGHEIIFASARSFRDCYPILKEKFARETLVALNGAAIIENGAVIKTFSIPEQSAKQLLSLCLEWNLSVFIDDALNHAYQGEEHISFMAFVDPQIGKRVGFSALGAPLKIVIFTNHDKGLIDKLYQELTQLTGISFFFHEAEASFYITKSGVNKATTICQLSQEPYICFGNDKNDIEMFQKALYAVQIGDYPDLKEYAHTVIDSDDHLLDNLCQTIKKLGQLYKKD